MGQKIKLTESQLNKVVAESIKKVLKEAQWSPEADGVGPSDVKGPAYFKKNGVVKVGSTEQGQVWATLGFFGNKHIAKSIGARWDTASNQNSFYSYTIKSNGLLFICKTAEGYYQLLYKNGRLEMAADVNDNAVDDLSRFQWVDAMVQPRFRELMNKAMEICKEERQYAVPGNAYKM